MGQKVNPHGARVGVIFDWSTRWYAGKKDFANNLVEDQKLRKMLKEKYYSTGISHIDIERTAQTITVNIFTAKPGMIIGRGGAGIEALKKDITEFLGRPAHINVMEIKNPDGDAQLVAENIAQQLEKRISFRRAMKQAQQRAMKTYGVKGIKTCVSGRLGGADIARTEQYHEEKSSYTFTRHSLYSETLSRGGKGALVNDGCGLIWSGFRPSDDACDLGYLIPSNMFASVVLSYLAEIAEKVRTGMVY